MLRSCFDLSFSLGGISHSKRVLFSSDYIG